MTRLVILVSLLLLAFKQEIWLQFLVGAMMIILIVKVLEPSRKEGFSIPPTYIEGAEQMSTVPPLYAEEYQIPSPVYDEITNVPKCYNETWSDEREHQPYGQYVSSGRLMPYQTATIQNMPLDEAKTLMNDSFTRDTLQFRNDMMRGYVNKLDRVYRQGQYDSVSPYGY